VPFPVAHGLPAGRASPLGGAIKPRTRPGRALSVAILVVRLLITGRGVLVIGYPMPVESERNAHVATSDMIGAFDALDRPDRDGPGGQPQRAVAG
jgi:hypothetical protein